MVSSLKRLKEERSKAIDQAVKERPDTTLIDRFGAFPFQVLIDQAAQRLQQGGDRLAFNMKEHLIKLKGKDYLQVMWRLVWLREEHPDWGIETEIFHFDEKLAVVRAYIKDATGRVLAMGTKQEQLSHFGDYLEKAETGAIGRACALVGYGTQFAPELDEDERIVDSPVDRKPVESGKPTEKPTEEKKSGTIGDTERKVLWEAAKGNGWNKDNYAAHLKTQGFNSGGEVTQVAYATLLHFFKNNKPKEGN